MKHSVCSKILILLTAALFTGCIEHEEISFEGVVIGTRNCSASIMDNNMGFFVKLFSPDSIGGTLTSTNGETIENVVVLYEPTRIIYVEDTIHGSFYLDDKYSRINGCIVYTDMDLPEGVFLRVAVD